MSSEGVARKLMSTVTVHDIAKKAYWKSFSEVLVAVYRHGTELIGYATSSGDAFPHELFTPSNDRNSNIAKVVVPSHLVASIAAWRARLKMRLEIYSFEKNEGIEVLYSNEQRVLKLAGNFEKVEVPAEKRVLKVLIVDDSKVIRTLLKDALGSEQGFEVVAESGKPSEVAALIEKHKPDVMTLDINMPEMNGVELIKTIGRAKLPATVVVSSLNMNEGTLVMQALENGAIDYIQKPSMSERKEFSEQLVEKLKVASDANNPQSIRVVSGAGSLASLKGTSLDLTGLILIGASTGGTEAVKAILRQLPKEVPPILIVQHIPPVFSKAFAESLDNMCDFHVHEASDGDVLKPGNAYVAPGGLQMRLERQRSGVYTVKVAAGEKISGHCPSVDALFDSAASAIKGTKSMALLLTGMGADGAKGLLKLKNLGVHTQAQSEETCVVFGMPKQAIKLGAADKVTNLHDMAKEIATYFRK